MRFGFLALSVAIAIITWNSGLRAQIPCDNECRERNKFAHLSQMGTQILEIGFE